MNLTGLVIWMDWAGWVIKAGTIMDDDTKKLLLGVAVFLGFFWLIGYFEIGLLILFIAVLVLLWTEC